jgi:hypothetical protein
MSVKAMATISDNKLMMMIYIGIGIWPFGCNFKGPPALQ